MKTLPADVAGCLDSGQCPDKKKCLRHNPAPLARRVWGQIFWSHRLNSDALNCPQFIPKDDAK